MKLYHYLPILGMLISFGCQNKPVTTVQNQNPTIATEQSCYSYVKNRDTATLMYMNSGAIITGELNYKIFEKDSNKGVIKGEMRGDTLVADYTFNSEGIESTRQVAFLNKDGQLIEGFGEVMEKDGKMIFKSLSTLKFEGSMVFTKENCK